MLQTDFTISDLRFLRQENAKKPITQPKKLISDYVERNRILPSNTPFPGFWRNERTPYLIEIMDCMSPFSPVQMVDLMKGVQLGATAAAENVMAYWMDENPAEILYISATQELLVKWATKRLEPLIDSCGFRHKIYAQTENKKSRRTGDKIFSKEFVGGNLDMSSAQSAAGLRSDSKRILIRDEVDGAPALLKTGEGNWLKVSEGRTLAWDTRRKIFTFSTPTLLELSLMWQEYQKGDRRKFLVPCPHCGKKQELKYGNDDSQYGIKAEREAGRIIRGYYLCEHCKDAIFNHHKVKFLSRGVWVPEAVNADVTRRSYHISSLYSPVGMLPWTALVKAREEATTTPDGMRAFVNLYLGLPFQESGSRPQLENVVELRGAYSAGSIPHGVLYLTMGIDVQRGSATNKANPPRVEAEILGIGAGYRTWSVDYKIFEGAIDDPEAGAWAKLDEWARAKEFKYERADGAQFSIQLVFIDSGDGMITDIVYRFCEGWTNTFPIKGFNILKKRKGEPLDEVGPTNFKRYRAAKSGDSIFYEISTNYYKKMIYRSLNLRRRDIEPQRPGFAEFPLDYGERYFNQMRAEEQRKDGSFHCPSGRRNEALDCRVYALCAADVYLDARVMDLKARLKKDGASPIDLQKINGRVIIESMQSMLENAF